MDKPAGGAKKGAAGGAKKAAAPAKRKKAAQVAAGGEGEEQGGGEEGEEQQPEAAKGPKFGNVKVRDDEPGAPATEPAVPAAAALCFLGGAQPRLVAASAGGGWLLLPAGS